MSPGCKSSLATTPSCHRDILPFLSRMFKFKPQTCGWQGTGGQTKSQTSCCQLLPAWPATLIPPVRGECWSGSRACHRFKLLRIARLNVKNPADNKCTETFGFCSLPYRVCCFRSRGKSELTHSCTEHLGLEEHSLPAPEPLFATPPSPDPLFDTAASA